MHEPWSPPIYQSPIQGFVVGSDFDTDPSLTLKNVFEPRSLPIISPIKTTSKLHALHTDAQDTQYSPISPRRSFSPSQSPVPQVWNRRFSESSSGSDRPLRRYSFDTDAYTLQRRQSVQSQGPVLKWLRKATVFLVDIFDEAEPLEPEDEFPVPESFNYKNHAAFESDSETELDRIAEKDDMEVLRSGNRLYQFFASERAHWLALVAIITAIPFSAHIVYEWLQYAVIGSAVLMGPTYTAGFYPVLGFVSLGFMVNFPAQVMGFGLILWLAREWHNAEVLRKSKQ